MPYTHSLNDTFEMRERKKNEYGHLNYEHFICNCHFKKSKGEIAVDLDVHVVLRKYMYISNQQIQNKLELHS